MKTDTESQDLNRSTIEESINQLDQERVVSFCFKNFNANKKILTVLQKIHGINTSLSRLIVKYWRINPSLKIGELELNHKKIFKELEESLLDSSKLTRQLQDYSWFFNAKNQQCHYTLTKLLTKKFIDISWKKKSKIYQGIRHIKKYPVRGQNTRNNRRKNKKKLSKKK